MKGFALSAQPVDLDAVRASLQHPGSGGFCSFEGWVRDNNEGRAVSGLEYEAYADLALSEGARIVDEAIARYGVLAAHGVHRTGNLAIGELAVWIGVSAAHRDEAFRACRYIIDEIKHRLPVWKKEHYLEGDTAWVACSHPAAGDNDAHWHAGPHAHGDGHSHPPAPLPAFQPDYSRQTRLPGVGAEGQAKLAAARVLVLGAGGLGVPVLGYLAGAGVGTLGIVDPDVLDASNLHRQTLYAASDIGRRKVDLARERIASLNPAVVVETFDEPLHAANVVDVFAGYDLVLECTDDMGSRYLSSDAAVLTATPLILASVYQFEGQLQVIGGQPGDPCLRCLWPEEPSPGSVGSCIESGVLGPVPGVLGAMQAMEALKLLLGLPRPQDNALLLVDLLGMTTQRLPVDARAGCLEHGSCVEVATQALARAQRERSIDLAFGRLEDALAAGFELVDVRNADEVLREPVSSPAGHIPADQLEAHAASLAHRRILLVCSSGRRSAHGARLLRGLGVHEAYSLEGGLAALAEASKAAARA